MHHELVARGTIAAGATWVPLHGGRTNSLWRVTWPGADVVCKLFATAASRNPLFPNDPRAESAVLRWLSGRNLAPQLLHEIKTPLGWCLIYSHVAGQGWRQGAAPTDREDAAAPARQGVAPIARVLAHLHGLPDAPRGLREIPSGSVALGRQTRGILSRCSPAAAAPLLALDPGGDTPPVRKTCVVHGDLVPANVLSTARGPILIDWQCPAIGDACEDLATFLSPAMQHLYGAGPLTKPEEEAFLTAYSNRKTVARYRRLAALFHWRLAAYCLWRSERGGGDYRQGLALEIAALEGQQGPISASPQNGTQHDQPEGAQH